MQRDWWELGGISQIMKGGDLNDIPDANIDLPTIRGSYIFRHNVTTNIFLQNLHPAENDTLQQIILVLHVFGNKTLVN